MHTEPFILRPQERERPMNVVGCSVTLLAANEQTGAHEFTLVTGPEGAGPPPHSHPWVESFFVLEGSVRFVLDGQAMHAEKGTLINIPAGTIHGFELGAEGSQMLEINGSDGSATRMFRAVDTEVPPGPPDPDFLVRLLARHHVTVPLPAAADV